MAVFANPNIVEDGLVLYLDAGNERSYTSGSIVWNDLSGNGNRGTVYNMLHSTDNGGKFYFNDSTSVCLIPNSPSLNPTTQLSIAAWVKFVTNSSDFIFEKGNVNTQYSLFSHSSDIVFRTYHSGDGSYHTQNPTKTAVGVVNGEWCYIVGSWDGTTKRIYVNGELKHSVAKSGNLVTQTTAAAVGRFGGTTTGYYFYGDIAKVCVYNIGLTSEQIKQNYNALRGRFGL